MVVRVRISSRDDRDCELDRNRLERDLASPELKVLPSRLRSPRDTYSGSHEQMFGAKQQAPHAGGSNKEVGESGGAIWCAFL